MALELNIQTKVETAQAEKSVNNLEGGFEDLNQDIGKTEQASKDAAKATKGMSTATKALGGAMKALGIGLIIAALATLREMIVNNQKVMDAINVTLETIGNLFNQITTAVGEAFEKVNKATGGFDALKKVGESLLTIVLTPIQLVFYGIVGAVQNAQLAWEKSFFGDNDPTTIRELNSAIAETEKNITDVAKGAIEAGKTIGENIGEAISEVGSLGSAVIDEVKEVSITAANEAAKANVQLQNSARLAAAEQNILIERYDRQAEKLRQIRDDDMKSIPERIKANEDLAAVLEKQTEIMIDGANLQIAAAQSTLERNNNIENQVALLEAQANKEGILAQIEGLRSEQLANRNALIREQAALDKEIEDQKLADEQARLDKRKEFEAARTKFEEQEAQKRIALEKQVQDAKLNIASAAFELGIALSEKNEKAQRAVAAAQAAYQGFLAVNVALASAPPPLNFILAGLVGGMAVLNVKKILSGSKDSASSGAGAAPSTTSAPTQETPRVPEFGFINQGVGRSQNAAFGTTRAYVISQEIKDQQALDSKINDIGKVG